MSDARRLHGQVRQYLLAGLSELEIAEKIGMSRAFAQRRKWAVLIGEVLGSEFLDLYFDEKITDESMRVLYHSYQRGNLKETWEEYKRGATIRRSKVERTPREIEAASFMVKDPKACKALRWVLGLEADPE